MENLAEKMRGEADTSGQEKRSQEGRRTFSDAALVYGTDFIKLLRLAEQSLKRNPSSHKCRILNSSFVLLFSYFCLFSSLGSH